MKETKCIAEFTTWEGKKIQQEIKKEWAQDIADAVAGQYFFANNVQGFSIRGSYYKHVDIYEVAI